MFSGKYCNGARRVRRVFGFGGVRGRFGRVSGAGGAFFGPGAVFVLSAAELSAESVEGGFDEGHVDGKVARGEDVGVFGGHEL